MSDDDKTTRRTPPKTEDDHLTIWQAVHRVDILWRAFGGLAQIVLNWKLIAPVFGFFVWYYWPKIVSTLAVLERLQ